MTNAETWNANYERVQKARKELGQINKTAIFAALAAAGTLAHLLHRELSPRWAGIATSLKLAGECGRNPNSVVGHWGFREQSCRHSPCSKVDQLAPCASPRARPPSSRGASRPSRAVSICIDMGGPQEAGDPDRILRSDKLGFTDRSTPNAAVPPGEPRNTAVLAPVIAAIGPLNATAKSCISARSQFLPVSGKSDDAQSLRSIAVV